MSERPLFRESHDEIILVDVGDNEIGRGAKLDVHRRGDLHRAFSVIVRNKAGELLLQKRAPGKYHSGGLWTNTCCGHPRPGEATRTAAARRLEEEMGIGCALFLLGTLIYRAELDGGMIEHEFVHIFAGAYDGPVSPDPFEVGAYAWRGLDEVRAELASTPARFSVWFRRYVEESWPVAPSAGHS
jgi:isopentenyl-diphosphate delta-isomerase